MFTNRVCKKCQNYVSLQKAFSGQERKSSHTFAPKDNVLTGYSSSGIDKPIGVSSCQLTRTLPESLQSVLPTVDQIEAELGKNFATMLS